MHKISVHLKTDALFVLIGIVMFNVYFLWQYPGIKIVYECNGLSQCYLVYIKDFYINTVFSALKGDFLSIGVVVLNIFIFLFLFNYGFRVFEWDEERFCIKSWFGKRCHSWKELDRVIVSTKFGSEWIFLVVWNNFYYAPYNSKLYGVLREICEKKKISVEEISDPYPELSNLRKRRKEHGTRMMLFQP